MDTLLLRPLLRSAGIGDDEVRRALRDGDLTLIRRGAYVAGAAPAFADARHRLLLTAAREHLVPDAVVSHVSAALIHGWDLWRTPLERVHVTRARAYGGRRGSRVHVHVAPVEPHEVCVVDGALVTSGARTAVDIARTLPFEQAVVVADAALRAGLPASELFEAAARVKGWPGAPAARRVVAFADGRSESVGESRSRVRLAAAGLAPRELQWPILDAGGRRIAITDFGWPERRTVAEFDGEIKYGRLRRPGEEPGDAVVREKRREDSVRAEDWAMVRWMWQDLDDFAPVAARLRRTLGSRTP